MMLLMMMHTHIIIIIIIAKIERIGWNDTKIRNVTQELVYTSYSTAHIAFHSDFQKKYTIISAVSHSVRHDNHRTYAHLAELKVECNTNLYSATNQPSKTFQNIDIERFFYVYLSKLLISNFLSS